MRKPPEDAFEYQVKQGARDFIYPRTPNLVGKVNQRLRELKNNPEPRRSFWGSGGFPLAVFTVILAISGVMSQLHFSQVIIEPTATQQAAPLAVVTPAPAELRTYEVDPEGMSLRDLYALVGAETKSQPSEPGPAIASINNAYLSTSGMLTLDEARRKAGLDLPGYPQKLGAPDRIFVTESVSPLVTMIWVNRNNPQTARYRLLVTLQLSQLSDKPVAGLKVHGYPASWADDGIYPLRYNDQGQVGQIEERLIGGQVLEWSDGVLSYRLEGRFTESEALSAAESLYQSGTSKHVLLSLSSHQERE